VKSVRAEDIVCRFGGEEFVVILPMADLKATRARAERIRSKLRELTVLHQGRTLGTITASIGVATLPDHGTSPKSLIEIADAALYRAKNQGRDRVVVADASGPATATHIPSSLLLPEKLRFNVSFTIWNSDLSLIAEPPRKAVHHQRLGPRDHYS